MREGGREVGPHWGVTIGLVRAKGGREEFMIPHDMDFCDFCVGGMEGKGRWWKGVREWNVL